jgi:HsdM N-terminal domain
MAIKKSELYSSLWQSCDALRGSMDASQYKDYVLVMLFVKYVSDKYAGQPYAAIVVPEGASFKDMVALKGSSNIGDDINKKILGPLAKANQLADMPDFDDATKLGSGKEKVDLLTGLIAIFEIGQMVMIFWAMRMNTSCATSPPSLARAKGSFTHLPKLAASLRRSLASMKAASAATPRCMTPLVGRGRCF